MSSYIRNASFTSHFLNQVETTKGSISILPILLVALSSKGKIQGISSSNTASWMVALFGRNDEAKATVTSIISSKSHCDKKLATDATMKAYFYTS
ncbi:hypothetical protein [Vibrio pectenicida]|uniref:hypothetical protein n=1 Tax=Vibrio pectenicida TaxID=62763 RepID=UPI001C118BD5|nr:hypothetical protein [Vibrio pectenicida]